MKSLARNTVAQSLPLLVGYVLSFLSGPIVVAGLGLRAFGIWALTGALAQYGSLLDLGVGRALSRFVALYEDDRGKTGEYVVAAACANAVVAVLLVLVALVGAPVVSGLLHGVSTQTMRVVLVASAVILAASMASRVVMAYPIGLRKMMAPNLALAGSLGLGFIATVVAIAAGAGLQGYALANAVAAVTGTLGVVLVAIVTDGIPPLAWPQRATIHELVSFAAKGQVVNLCDMVNFQSDKVVIALTVGASAAGAYELANRVAAAARAVGVFTVSAMVPTLTAEMRIAGVGLAAGRYERLTQASASIGLPVVIFTGTAAPFLLAAWLGKAPAHSAVILAALCAAYLVNTSSGVGYCMASAAGRPEIPARTATITALLNIAATAALAPLLGLWGVLGGTVVALSAGALLQVVRVQGAFGIPMRTYRSAIGSVFVPATLLAAPVAAAAISVPAPGRALAAGILITLGMGYAAAYSVIAVRRRLLPRAVVSHALQMSARLAGLGKPRLGASQLG